jgi:hypothetical protein
MNKHLAFDDRTVKLIGIPALGVLIPNLSGLITNRLYRSAELLGSYLYFITLFFLIWEGNVRLLNFIRQKYPWNRNSYPKIIIALFFANIIYSSLLSFLWLKAWKIWSLEPDDDRGQMTNCILLIIIRRLLHQQYLRDHLPQPREKNITNQGSNNSTSPKPRPNWKPSKTRSIPILSFNSLNTLSLPHHP